MMSLSIHGSNGMLLVITVTTTTAPSVCSCRTGERISFSYLISQKFVGESARCVVLRNGEQKTLDVK